MTSAYEMAWQRRRRVPSEGRSRNWRRGCGLVGGENKRSEERKSREEEEHRGNGTNGEVDEEGEKKGGGRGIFWWGLTKGGNI